MAINESKLSRVWQHFTDPNRSAAILTAFRGEYDREENLRRNRTLAAELRNLGYGIVYVDGFWVENPGTPEEIRVAEDSILVTAPADKSGAFAESIAKLGNKYEQEAVVVKDSRGTRLIFKDGSEEPLGEIKPGQLSDIYTKLRTNKQASTFVFEGERDDLGFIQRLAGIKSK